MFERAGRIAPGWELDIPPAISAFNPKSGSSGTIIVITGMYLTSATGIWLGDMPISSFKVDSATQITVMTPSRGASGLLKVTTPAGSALSADTFDFGSGSSN